MPYSNTRKLLKSEEVFDLLKNKFGTSEVGDWDETKCKIFSDLVENGFSTSFIDFEFTGCGKWITYLESESVATAGWFRIGATILLKLLENKLFSSYRALMEEGVVFDIGYLSRLPVDLEIIKIVVDGKLKLQSVFLEPEGWDPIDEITPAYHLIQKTIVEKGDPAIVHHLIDCGASLTPWMDSKDKKGWGHVLEDRYERSKENGLYFRGEVLEAEFHNSPFDDLIIWYIESENSSEKKQKIWSLIDQLTEKSTSKASLDINYLKLLLLYIESENNSEQEQKIMSLIDHFKEEITCQANSDESYLFKILQHTNYGKINFNNFVRLMNDLFEPVDFQRTYQKEYSTEPLYYDNMELGIRESSLTLRADLSPIEFIQEMGVNNIKLFDFFISKGVLYKKNYKPGEKVKERLISLRKESDRIKKSYSAGLTHHEQVQGFIWCSLLFLLVILYFDTPNQYFYLDEKYFVYCSISLISLSATFFLLRIFINRSYLSSRVISYSADLTQKPFFFILAAISLVVITERPLFTLGADGHLTPVLGHKTTNHIGIAMVVIPAGNFLMGSCIASTKTNDNIEHNVLDQEKLTTDCRYPDPDAEEKETPQHLVKIKAFQMSETEVTLGQFKQFIAATGRRDLVNDADFIESNVYGDDAPVTGVSWNDAQDFIKWLNSEKNGGGYRLPSEAEWEYACRAGEKHIYCGGDDMDVVGWYNGNSDYRPHPVRGKASNAFGLFDMSGNAHEWVEDCGNSNYLQAPSDGSAWTSGWCGVRVLRGGVFTASAELARAAFRYDSSHDFRFALHGFRLARSL